MPLRLTQKRSQILHTLKKCPGTLSATELHEKLPDIDLVTIYRNLDLFVQEKMIRRVHLGTEEARYEYQNEPHHHAVCTDCNKVLHFTAPDREIKKLLGIKDFEVDEIEVTVRGICKKTQRKT